MKNLTRILLVPVTTVFAFSSYANASGACHANEYQNSKITEVCASSFNLTDEAGSNTLQLKMGAGQTITLTETSRTLTGGERHSSYQRASLGMRMSSTVDGASEVDMKYEIVEDTVWNGSYSGSLGTSGNYNFSISGQAANDWGGW